MLKWIIILLVIAVCIFGWELFKDGEKNDSSFERGLLCGLVLGIVCLLFYIGLVPSAMDVYRGKTMIRTTYELYEGSYLTPIDSTVLFKENIW